MPLTAKEMLPAIGQTFEVRFESCWFYMTVADVKHVYGRPRLFVVPAPGYGGQWIELDRIRKANSTLGVEDHAGTIRHYPAFANQFDAKRQEEINS